MSTTLKGGQESFLEGRRIVWFSCGAASAVAAKVTLERWPDAVIVNCNTMPDEHPDNTRFYSDVEEWLGKKIEQIGNPKYKTCDEVFEQTRYMSGPAGARCTTELKKAPRLAYQWAEDLHTFGFTADEEKRIKSFEYNNPELLTFWVMRDMGITKTDCYKIISDAGIELPEMYKLGYRNNNCRGCVKASSPGYWNKVRKDFPDMFEKRATRSRELGCKLILLKGERIFLDELPPNVGTYKGEDLSCGPTCNGQPVTERITTKEDEK